MMEVVPSAAYALAALLVGVMALLASVPLRGQAGPGLGAGARWAMLVGASLLAVLAGWVELSGAALLAAEGAGTELVSTFPSAYTWALMVPILALGTSVLAVSARQVLRGHLRGAGGWIGLLTVALVVGLQEMGRRVWVAEGDRRVHVRTGLLFPREEANVFADVEAVEVLESELRGSPVFTVSLRGERLSGAITTAALRFVDPAVARAEAERWALAVGTPVREDKQRD
jgi:hypothetical protein